MGMEKARGEWPKLRLKEEKARGKWPKLQDAARTLSCTMGDSFMGVGDAGPWNGFLCLSQMEDLLGERYGLHMGCGPLSRLVGSSAPVVSHLACIEAA